MSKVQLKDFLHSSFEITDEEIAEIVVGVVDAPRNTTPVFPMDSWAKMMAFFLRGSLEQKIKYCYKVYDKFNQGHITKNTMTYLLRHAFVMEGGGDDEDTVRVSYNNN